MSFCCVSLPEVLSRTASDMSPVSKFDGVFIGFRYVDGISSAASGEYTDPVPPVPFVIGDVEDIV